MKNIIRKISAIALAFTLLGTSTAITKTIAPKSDNTLVASAATCPNCHGGSYWTSWSDWHETNVEYHWYFLVITDTHYEERTCTCTKCGKVIQTQHRHRTHYQSGEISSWDSWTYDD